MRWGTVVAGAIMLGTLPASAVTPPNGAKDAATQGAQPADPVPNDDGVARPLLGARGGEAGDVTAVGSLSLVLILPAITLEGRLDIGGGAFVQAGYRNIAAFGHEARGRIGWGAHVAGAIDIGVVARTSYTSLHSADGSVVGIQFSNLTLGNDVEVGNDIALSWTRPGSAHVSVFLGPTFTLGGERYTGFEEGGFQFDPAWRSINAAVQGEWALFDDANLFLRLDAMMLMGIEKDEACVQARQQDCDQLAPIGFLPTGTVGIAWSAF